MAFEVQPAGKMREVLAGGGIAIGPVLLGAAKPIHILTPGATVRRIVNMSALTAAEAKAWSSPAPLEREQRLG